MFICLCIPILFQKSDAKTMHYLHIYVVLDLR